jgi:hypothetical protein
MRAIVALPGGDLLSVGGSTTDQVPRAWRFHAGKWSGIPGPGTRTDRSGEMNGVAGAGRAGLVAVGWTAPRTAQPAPPRHAGRRSGPRPTADHGNCSPHRSPRPAHPSASCSTSPRHRTAASSPPAPTGPPTRTPATARSWPHRTAGPGGRSRRTAWTGPARPPCAAADVGRALHAGARRGERRPTRQTVLGVPMTEQHHANRLPRGARPTTAWDARRYTFRCNGPLSMCRHRRRTDRSICRRDRAGALRQ